jgi:hypothetical protein
VVLSALPFFCSPEGRPFLSRLLFMGSDGENFYSAILPCTPRRRTFTVALFCV